MRGGAFTTAATQSSALHFVWTVRSKCERPSSSFLLTPPPREQGLSPVLHNGLIDPELLPLYLSYFRPGDANRSLLDDQEVTSSVSVRPSEAVMGYFHDSSPSGPAPPWFS